MILTAVNGHLTECPNYGEDLCHLNQNEEIFLYIYTENVSGFWKYENNWLSSKRVKHVPVETGWSPWGTTIWKGRECPWGILFCGHGLKTFLPLIGTNSKTTHYLYFCLSNPKGTAKAPVVDLLRLNTLRGLGTKVTPPHRRWSYKRDCWETGFLRTHMSAILSPASPVNRYQSSPQLLFLSDFVVNLL